MSIILKPELYPYEAPQLTLLTATVLADVIMQKTSLNPKIKWPNDVLLQDKKIAGILTEMKAEQDDVEYVIIGTGININQSAEEFPHPLKERATSLRRETNKIWSIKEIIQDVLSLFEQRYDLFLQNGFQDVKKKWENYGYRMGDDIEIKSGDKKWSAKFIGIAEDGALLTKSQDKKIEKIYSAEIDWFKEGE